MHALFRKSITIQSNASNFKIPFLTQLIPHFHSLHQMAKSVIRQDFLML